MPIFEQLSTLSGEQLDERGFTVLGVPCNQFGEQEPGSAVARFRPTVEPESDELIAAIEAELPS
jgi:glutathione peroxidase-family protein